MTTSLRHATHGWRRGAGFTVLAAVIIGVSACSHGMLMAHGRGASGAPAHPAVSQEQ